MKERMEDANGLAEQNFEERTKSFILRAQQRFEILERKRKRSEGNVKEDLVMEKEFRIKRQADGEDSDLSGATFPTESSNPLDSLLKRVRDQSGRIVKDLKERWNRTVEVLKDGVSQVEESAKEVGQELGKRWDSFKDSTSALRNRTVHFEEFVTAKQGDSKKEVEREEEESPSKGKRLMDRIRGLFSSQDR